MTDTMAVIAAALHADAEAVRVISLNVANSQTPAYRREISVVRASFAEALDGLELPQLQTVTDARAGTLQSTGEPLNLAIEGKGFFVVGTANGEMLTRRGDFRLDAEGRLATHAGDPVLGTRGVIQVGDRSPSILADGTVQVGDAPVDRLRIVSVADESALRPVGDGLFAMSEGGADVAAPYGAVRQGFLETSNVQAINETVRLLEAMRRFEMAQRFVRGYDGMMEQAISTLGRI
jgi:flagellar basal-body rod protein FlgF